MADTLSRGDMFILVSSAVSHIHEKYRCSYCFKSKTLPIVPQLLHQISFALGHRKETVYWLKFGRVCQYPCNCGHHLKFSFSLSETCHISIGTAKKRKQPIKLAISRPDLQASNQPWSFQCAHLQCDTAF